MRGNTYTHIYIQNQNKRRKRQRGRQGPLCQHQHQHQDQDQEQGQHHSSYTTEKQQPCAGRIHGYHRRSWTLVLLWLLKLSNVLMTTTEATAVRPPYDNENEVQQQQVVSEEDEEKSQRQEEEGEGCQDGSACPPEDGSSTSGSGAPSSRRQQENNHVNQHHRRLDRLQTPRGNQNPPLTSSNKQPTNNNNNNNNHEYYYKKIKMQPPPASGNANANANGNKRSQQRKGIKQQQQHPQLSQQQQLYQKQQQQRWFDEFMTWCVNDRKIHTLLYVDTFEYESNGQTTPVRGLAAGTKIVSGEVVLSIPFDSLFSLSTIENDPIMSPILGHHQQKHHGWYDEMQVLIVYLLYQHSLGASTPWAPYLNMLHTATVEDMPFMWEEAELHRVYPEVSHGVRMASESILADVEAMYEEIIPVLVETYPVLFAPVGGWEKEKEKEEGEVAANAENVSHSSSSSGSSGSSGSGGEMDGNTVNDSEESDASGTTTDEEWPYSFENFRWAFAMLNSRHWHLPCRDLDMTAPEEEEGSSRSSGASTTDKSADTSETNIRKEETTSTSNADAPSKATITNSNTHAKQQQEQQQHEEEDGTGTLPQEPPSTSITPRTHTFLAPLADMLNFGKPCTRAEYNTAGRTFDVIATCDFIPGQEVTFWYTNECEDVVLANFGFTHPMIGKCQKEKEKEEDGRSGGKSKVVVLEKNLEEERRRADRLERHLLDALSEIQTLKGALRRTKERLGACACPPRKRPGNAHSPANNNDEQPFDDDYVETWQDGDESGNAKKRGEEGDAAWSSSSVYGGGEGNGNGNKLRGDLKIEDGRGHGGGGGNNNFNKPSGTIRRSSWSSGQQQYQQQQQQYHEEEHQHRHYRDTEDEDL